MLWIRITPARAGKSAVYCLLTLICAGSPPRVRGKGLKHRGTPRADGITPACAGKRSLPAPPKASAWDHPRVCGEKCMCGW